MRYQPGRAQGGWSAELAVCLFALALAFGTLAWMDLLHAHVLPGEPEAGGDHVLRDGLLLLPLALAAAWWAMRPGRRPGAGPARQAAGSAGLFALLVAPAAAAHSALHAADEMAVAHADGPARMSGQAAAAGGGDGPVDSLVHGATDALLALLAAFLLCLGALALLRWRGGGRTACPAAPRRRLLLAVSTLVVAAAAAMVPVSGAASPEYPKFSMPLVIPPTLTGPNIDLRMAETQEQILPTGPATTMWTYNGTFPGPTIRRPSGVATKVTVTNDLPPSAGSMTLHHHGAQTTEDSDGQPSTFLIPPGATKAYTYPALDEGAAERAAPQWYHDHRDMVTGRNVWMGLMGAFIYDDPVEQGLNLPKDEYDLPLMVADRQFDAANQIPYQFVSGGTLGDVLLVNGVPQPFHEVGDRRYRFRLYNVSNARDYTFRLSNGQAITQIGTDSGLLPASVSRQSIRLGPAERADVVIDFQGRLGQNIVLENADAAFGPGDRDAEIMEFRVTKDLPETSSPVPAALRPLPTTGAPVTTRTWSFDRTDARWTISGKAFDPDRVDARPTLGTTERWVFRNPTTLPHLVHTHLADQKLVSRDGRPPGPSERLKDLWYVNPGEEVIVDVRFTDYEGRFLLHCHVLEHEDDGMMTQFETARPPAGPVDPPPGAVPAPPSGVAPPTSTPADTLSRAVSILSSKRLGQILRRGLRFQAAAPASGTTMRATLSVRRRKVGTVRRTGLARGRVTLTLKLSRAGKARLRLLLAGRRGAAAVLKVSAGTERPRARFTIRR